jgi:glycosyltransferase involved in cell wall biosynthesis
MSVPLSVLILTKNEGRDIAGCIRSVQWSDDIHVLDSHSTDATVEIAERLGAKVTKRKFDTFSAQRNFGVRELPYKHAWLLMVDADERIPAELAAEIEQFLATPLAEVAAARIRRRDFWWGTWLKHAALSPFSVRLFRRDAAHFTREINEVLNINGKIADLSQFFDHHSFSKGLHHWFDKHNLYSDMEAQLIADGRSIEPSWRTALFDENRNTRRVHQKALFYKMPARPFIKLFYMLVIRMSFLDGWAGIRYSILQCVYEYMIVLKTKEILAERAEQPNQQVDAT